MSISTLWPPTPIIGGILTGLACLAAGVLVAGMGHGWGLPTQYGGLSILLWTLALIRLRPAPSWRADTVRSLPFLILGFVFSIGIEAIPAEPLAPYEDIVALVVPVVLALIGWGIARAGRSYNAWGDAMLLAIGLGLNAAALADYRTDLRAGNSGGLLLPWLVLWLGWQLVAAYAMVKNLRAAPQRP